MVICFFYLIRNQISFTERRFNEINNRLFVIAFWVGFTDLIGTDNLNFNHSTILSVLI
jgi:hypothetical protein